MLRMRRSRKQYENQTFPSRAVQADWLLWRRTHEEPIVKQSESGSSAELQLAEDSHDGIDIDALAPGTTLVVDTHNSRYRFIVLLDPGVLLVRQGAMRPDQTVVRLAGATNGGALKEGWILIGRGIELRVGVMWIRSSPVRSVTIENVPPSYSADLREM